MGNNESAPKGALSIRRIPVIQRPSMLSYADVLRYGTPGMSLSKKARWQARNAKNFRRSLNDQVSADNGRLFAIGHLWLAKIRLNGDAEDLGLVSCRVVTNNGVAFIVDAFQNLVEVELMHFHGVGTGVAAEAATDAALGVELTTQYSTSNTRSTGTSGEKSGDAKTFETTATVTVSATVAITEHGIFSTVTTGTGVLLDRSVFAAVNLASGESLQATYQLTFPSGS